MPREIARSRFIGSIILSRVRVRVFGSPNRSTFGVNRKIGVIFVTIGSLDSRFEGVYVVEETCVLFQKLTEEMLQEPKCAKISCWFVRIFLSFFLSSFFVISKLCIASLCCFQFKATIYFARGTGLHILQYFFSWIFLIPFEYIRLLFRFLHYPLVNFYRILLNRQLLSRPV